MLTVDSNGVFPIAPTPFLADGAIDAASVDCMIDHYVAAGAGVRCVSKHDAQKPTACPSRRLSEAAA